MPSEIEAKLKVEEFDTIRRRLVLLHAKRLGLTHETNTFYDDSHHSLRSSDRGLRLRENRRESGQTDFVITVKGPQKPGPFKNREEAELGVTDATAADAVLRVLGYQPTLSFEKRRESWELNDCKIELDELPILGKFVEIEGPNVEAISSVREQLNLATARSMTTGYISMLSKYLSETGDPRKSIEF